MSKYAICRTDNIPHLVGGEVTRFKPEGFCEIRGYRNVTFKIEELFDDENSLNKKMKRVYNKMKLLWKLI